MSSANSPKPALTAAPVASVLLPVAAAARSGAPVTKPPRWPRVNAALDTALRILSLAGLGFLKPIVAMCRGEDPRVHLRQLWLDLGAPVFAIAVFLFLWGQVSTNIVTSLGKIPGPA